MLEQNAAQVVFSSFPKPQNVLFCVPDITFALPGPLERCLCFAAPFRSVGRNLELAKMLSFPVFIVPSNDGYKMADEVYFE